jgi:RNA polymerase sigma-70 factor (ECF subfamily)
VAGEGGERIDEAAVRQLEPVLYRFALRATRNPELSRDLTQEALLAAVAQAATFAERSSLRTWVVGILAHKVTDHRRRSAVRRVVLEDEGDLLATPSAEDVERVVSARQELRAVDRALAALPERERLALLLLDVECVDRTEACNALGVSATHLRVLLHRARTASAGCSKMNVDPCQAVRPHFSDHLDGERLPFFRRLMVRFHLAVCPPCRRVHRSLVATRDALGALRDEEPHLDDLSDGANQAGK